VRLCHGWLVAAICALVGVLAPTGAIAASDPDCLATYGSGVPARVLPALRFGIDPGMAGSAGGAQLPTVADDPARDLSELEALRPRDRLLVVRLNRLFFSAGAAGISQFRAQAERYTRAGFEVEVQVRYHPSSAENGDLAAWQAYVRQVVDAFGPNRSVVAMTITNEVNLTGSPNTSDGSYKDARQALIDGIEAAHAEARRRGFRQLRFGFTYAYRFVPQSDASFFQYLGSHGGRPFRAALSFVGMDFYPGTFYPPAMAPGASYGSAMVQALATLRECFLPEARIGLRTPIWITEDGVPTGATISDAAQATALRELVQAARDYSRTFDVTDYRWFNLRDSQSNPFGSLPGAALGFTTDGLLSDVYARKPSFGAYRELIARYGAPDVSPRRRRPDGRRRHRRRRQGAPLG
jgi:hypothetical protein